MKTADIKVGEMYAYSRSQDVQRWWDARRVRVVDMGPFVEGRYPSAMSIVVDGQETCWARRSDKGNRIAVRDENGGNLLFVTAANIKAPWTEYLALKDEAQRAQREREERAAAARVARDTKRHQIQQRLTEAGLTRSHWRWESDGLFLTIADVETLLDKEPSR